MLHKEQDFFLLLSWAIFSSFLLYYFSLPLIVSGFTFYIIPALYLSLKCPRFLVKKITLVSFIFWAILFLSGIILLGNNAWVDNSFFRYRLFGFFDLEYLLFGFFYLYFIVIFYEYFFEHHTKKEKIKSHLLNLIILLSILAITLFAYVLFFKEVPKIPYAYGTIGIIFLLAPSFLMLYRYPHLIKKFSAVTLFFFFQTFMYEMVALKVNYWTFPLGDAKYWSWVTFFNVSFPLEEFLFFLIITPSAILSYYEFFDDDRK